jgi:hypothetical protein
MINRCCAGKLQNVEGLTINENYRAGRWQESGNNNREGEGDGEGEGEGEKIRT